MPLGHGVHTSRSDDRDRRHHGEVVNCGEHNIRFFASRSDADPDFCNCTADGGVSIARAIGG